MREIKFRAWDGKKMVSPDCILRDGQAFWRGNSIPETSSTVMQFTGLMDINGVEIYEGDVVYEILWIGTEEYQHVIDDIRRLPLWRDADYPEQTWEVIGNIYEHPELLK